MECNRSDRCKEIPKAPDCRAGGLWFRAVARANGCVKPDSEDAHQETPHGEHGKRTAVRRSAERGYGRVHVFGKNHAIQNEFKNVDTPPRRVPRGSPGSS